MNTNFTSQLFDFVDLAGKSTYASGKPPLKTSERRDFIEFDFKQGDWDYLDSYTGHTKSAGQEVVRFQGKIVWTNSYCGGMTEGNEQLAHDTFSFLKTALSQDDDTFRSLRGPQNYKAGNWEYRYRQEGDITNFSGYEEILYQGKVVFFHRAIGGTINHD
ncbi:MAG TPA: DUF5680 domain-containing protein [Vitreimonas sp.]|nr:DUF5680 domain-containing protein [Vitreimonas sp.]